MAVNIFRLHRSQSGRSHYAIALVQQPTRPASQDVVEKTQKRFPNITTDIPSLRKGTGGRSSFSGKIATVFGASGNLGRFVVNQLGKIGTQVIVPYRTDPYNIARLKLCGDLGQILFSPFYLKDEESIYKAMKHSHIVINLIGQNFETKNFSFEDVHVKGARDIARIAKECGVQTLVHVSALNACEKPKPIILKKGSKFYATKWEAEQAVRQEFPEAIIFRPSDMWGQQDNFLRYYTDIARKTWRCVSLWNRGNGIVKQPVYIGNVAKGIVKAVFDSDAIGHTFQAVGMHRYELGELVDWFYRVMDRTADNLYYRLELRYDFTIWFRVMYAEKVFTRWRRLSWERLEREHTTDVVLPSLPTLEDLGVELTPFEERIFYELKPFRRNAYKDPMLTDYIRPVEPCPFAQG